MKLMKIMQKQLDVVISAIFIFSFFALYSHLALRLSQGIYFDYLNLGFDFDPPYFVDHMVGELSTSVNYKHPLAMLFRPFAELFLLLGFQPKEASALVMASFGGMSVALVYGFCRMAFFGVPEALASASFFGVSATPMFTSIIAESYGWASFSIVLVWCAFLYSTKRNDRSFKYRLTAAVLASGVTITNVLHALVAEFFLWLKTRNLKQSLFHAILFGIAVAFVLLVILAVLQPRGLWTIATQPMQTAKEVYWMRTKGDTVNIDMLVATYFTYSFFAPAFTEVAISPTSFMVDFRQFSFKFGEMVVVYLWWIFAIVGCWSGFRDEQYRRVALPLAVILAINFLFHLDYQYRGSVYLYAAHLHFPILALACGAGPWVSKQKWHLRLGYSAILGCFVFAAILINGPRAGEFSRMFDSLSFPSDDPSIVRQ